MLGKYSTFSSNRIICLTKGLVYVLKRYEKIISQFLSDQGAVAVKMATGCLRKIEKINICIKLAKVCFQLLMKIWDSVYICKIICCSHKNYEGIFKMVLFFRFFQDFYSAFLTQSRRVSISVTHLFHQWMGLMDHLRKLVGLDWSEWLQEKKRILL